jgi:DNA-binding GntR family transcriptional regulator
MTALVNEGDITGYSRLNAEFHETLVSACQNEHLIDMLRLFNKKTLRYRMEVLSSPGKLQESLEKHEKLIESIKRGDAREAERVREDSILANIPLIEKTFAQNAKEETQ